MKRILPSLLSGFIPKLFLFKNSIALSALKNLHNIVELCKSTNSSVAYYSVFIVFQQNGTERQSNLAFGNLNPNNICIKRREVLNGLVGQ